MADCGDCDCDCDCLCPDCDCDCWACDCFDNCCSCDCFDNCCSCDCFDNCCSGEVCFILCCFLPPPDDDRRRNAHRRSSISYNCSICYYLCYKFNRKKPPASTTQTDKPKDQKYKRIFSRIKAYFGRERNPPSEPTENQPNVEIVPQKVDNKQDGRYPMANDNNRLEFDYENHTRRSNHGEVYRPSQGHIIDGRWSKPTKLGDFIGGR